MPPSTPPGTPMSPSSFGRSGWMVEGGSIGAAPGDGAGFADAGAGDFGAAGGGGGGGGGGGAGASATNAIIVGTSGSAPVKNSTGTSVALTSAICADTEIRIGTPGFDGMCRVWPVIKSNMTASGRVALVQVNRQGVGHPGSVKSFGKPRLTRSRDAAAADYSAAPRNPSPGRRRALAGRLARCRRRDPHARRRGSDPDRRTGTAVHRAAPAARRAALAIFARNGSAGTDR